MAVIDEQSDLLSTRSVGLAIAGLCVWGAYRLTRYAQREAYLPPGPPTKPLVGNILIWPRKGAQHKFKEWASQYGEIFSLKLAHQTVIVLSSQEAIHHVLEKNSAISSDRPAIHLKDRIEGQNNNLALGRYTPRWRSLRRAAQQILSSQACRRHLPIQQAESLQLLYDTLQHPEEVRTFLRRAGTSVISSVMFGVRYPRPTTPLYLQFWNMLERQFRLASPAEYPPVDIFPILKYLPERWAKWKVKCREIKVDQEAVFKTMLQPVHDRLARGEQNGAFMEEVSLRAEEWGLDQAALLPFGYSVMAGGSETSASFVSVVLLCLAAHPEVMCKIHEEMDRVVGMDRMPELDDFENLPYLQAAVNEVHRFRPIVPLSVPHAATDDIHYKQYVIPKGSIIFQNTWGFFHDPDVWGDSETFRPERFIENPELLKYVEYAFGAGRRFCVGIHLAESSLRINTMNMVWCFNIRKALDSNGKEIEPDLNFTSEGIASAPTEVNLTIKPRTAHHERILRESFKEAEAAFLPFEYDLSEDERKYAEELRAGA